MAEELPDRILGESASVRGNVQRTPAFNGRRRQGSGCARCANPTR
jgi:hypothetical protein